MSASLHHQLTEISQRLNRWQGLFLAAVWGSAWLGVLVLLAFTDLLLQLNDSGRWLAATVASTILAVGLWRVLAALRVRRSLTAVAARLEHAFPQLDNHLINRVQFETQENADHLATAYRRHGVPGWADLDFSQLRDQRRDRRAFGFLLVMLALVAAPAVMVGPGWGNALTRVLNPLSTRPAATLAEVLAVEPGDTTVTAGAALTITTTAEGQRGQEVWLELWPSDDQPTRLALGQLDQAREPIVFAHALSSVRAPLEYRIRAGDARSARYQVTVRPPLALTALTAVIQPPAYTGLAGNTVDVLAQPLRLPQGSQLIVQPVFNRALDHGAVRVAGVPAARTATGWRAVLRDVRTRDLSLMAEDDNGEKFESVLPVELVPDQAPRVRVLAPTQRVALLPGTPARIQFEINDDYGLESLQLEREGGDAVEAWPVDGQREFAGMWTGVAGQYRLVARDAVQETRSTLIVFDEATPEAVLEAQNRAAGITAATLARVIAWQRENLERTTGLSGGADPGVSQALSLQRQIREATGQLLIDPRRPLGTLVSVVEQLHREPMLQAIDVLDRLPTAAAARQPQYLVQAIALESSILRGLLATRDSYERIEQHRKVSDLLAMMDALVSGESAVVKEMEGLLTENTSVPVELVTRQDRLAGDVNAFVKAAREEAVRVEGHDAAFAQLVRRVADECGRRAVAANLLRAAERLEAAKTDEALAFARPALAALLDFQKWLNAWRVAAAQTTLEQLREVVADSKVKFEKLVALQSEVVETIREVEAMEDLSQAEHDQFLEELKAMQANIREAALKVADDLHIFPELPVGNELVQDIYQVFEEVRQVPGSESAPADELGLQKEDFILEAMENIKERFDDMEMWLVAEPDKMKRLTENFDQTEMPEMAVIPLPEEIEDIIGQLLEQQDEIREQADDAATNQAMPDMPMGWDIAEGEWSTFSAKGKSGNERPEHKDQDGRSIVGREGMSDGETAAGSGKINEGDEQIDERRTRDSAQAGQVAEEEHTDAKATGGGKLSGYDDETGMSGEGPRRDANLPGSPLGMQAMLRRDAEALHARATLLHIRTGSLDDAVRAMRDAEEALREGVPIQRVREFQRRASAALQRAQVDLAGGVYTESLAGGTGAIPLTDQLAGVPEEAPANYRDLVAEYFKSLSAAP